MTRTDGYHGGRGGHAPDDLREALLDYIEKIRDTGATEYAFINGETKQVTWLLGQLWNCSDPLPQEARAMLDQHFGLDRTPRLATFGSAARFLAGELNRLAGKKGTELPSKRLHETLRLPADESGV